MEVKINETRTSLEKFKSEILHIAKLNMDLSKSLSSKDKVLGVKIFKFACELIQGLYKGERNRLQVFQEMERVTLFKLEKEMDGDAENLQRTIQKAKNSLKKDFE